MQQFVHTNENNDVEDIANEKKKPSNIDQK